MMLTSQIGRYKRKSKLKNQNVKLRNSTKLRSNFPSILNFNFLFLNSRRIGFTLLELIVVIFIISLAAALIMPSVWESPESEVKAEAKHISSVLRYIYDEAIGKKQTYLFKINLDNNSYGFESKKESRSYRIKKDGELKDVIIPSLGEVLRGEVIVEFGPLGPGEPIIVHLINDEAEYTVIFNHLNGRTKILEGYTL